MRETSYPESIARLVAIDELCPIGPGERNPSVYDDLRTLTVDAAFAPHVVMEKDMAQACLAGLWLRHNFLDESHEISQEIATPTGSYWHGLMHRREPDFGNAAYWFRRAGPHPVFPELAQQAAAKAAEHPGREARFLRTQQQWDPFAFIDLCQNAWQNRNNAQELCRRIQDLEWSILFDYCLHQALGAES